LMWDYNSKTYSLSRFKLRHLPQGGPAIA